MSWEQCAAEYVHLLEGRQIEAVLSPANFNEAVLLCSEASPDRFHRRLAKEYLASARGVTQGSCIDFNRWLRRPHPSDADGLGSGFSLVGSESQHTGRQRAT